MIDAKGIFKAYGEVQALQDVSFQIDAGEVVGLLGPNGAGKTTLMKVLTGFLQPDEGQVLIDDRDILTDTLAVQSRIGYLPESAPLYPESSVQSHLSMMADLRRVPPEQKVRLISQAVRATALGRPVDPAHQRVEQGLPAAGGTGPDHPSSTQAAGAG